MPVQRPATPYSHTRYNLRSLPYIRPEDVMEPTPEEPYPGLTLLLEAINQAQESTATPETPSQYLDHTAPAAEWEQETIDYQRIADQFIFPDPDPIEEQLQEQPPEYDAITIESDNEDESENDSQASEDAEMARIIEPQGCMSHLHRTFNFEIQMALHLVQCNAQLEDIEIHIDQDQDDFDWSQAYVKRMAATLRRQRVHDLDAFFRLGERIEYKLAHDPNYLTHQQVRIFMGLSQPLIDTAVKVYQLFRYYPEAIRLVRNIDIADINQLPLRCIRHIADDIADEWKMV